MRYLTAFLVFLVLVLFDVLVMAATLTVVVGLFLADAGVYNNFPFSFEFAKKIWT